MSYSVKFENVTKRYSRGGPRYASLRHDLSGAVDRLGQRLRGKRVEPRGTLALEDVFFEVDEGESFAIIGPNGSGKTTALKLISRISYPTGGKVRVRGRVGALIEVGSGVHPELTGRENILLYGRILGMSRSEVASRFEEIVEFAELGHVMDTPVKMYSTGMQLRIGFAIASHLDPDVFVVDEALAVGDAGFQAKCVERMTKLVAEGRTLLFVSHNLSAVEAICRRGLFLLDGRVECEGSTRDAMRAYLDWIDERHHARQTRALAPRQSSYLSLESVTCHDGDGSECYAFRTGEDVEVRMIFRTSQLIKSPYVSIGINDGRPGSLSLCSMLVDGAAPSTIDGQVTIACKMKAVPLLPRVYEIWCSVRSGMAFGDIFDWQPVGSFRITEAPTLAGPAATAHTSQDAPIHIVHDWRIEA